MFTVFRAVLILIHFLYDLLYAFRNSCLIVCRKCTEILCGENLQKEIEMLVESADRARKLPRHLVIVFGTKEDTILDCIRIIGWCMTLGIPCVSFFDSNGFLARNENVLKKEVAEKRPDLLEYISWGKPSTPPGRNGLTSSKSKIRVLLLSYMDSKGTIVSLSQELAKAVSTGSLKLEEINDQLLAEKLNFPGVPDPELAMVYGHVCCTYGLLPWHTRTTEFLTLPLHDSLTVKDFVYLLERYSKCEQRYGK